MFVSRGLEKPKTHSGLIAEFGKRFVKDGPLDRTFGATLGKLESLRSYADYTLEPTPRGKAEQALEVLALRPDARLGRLPPCAAFDRRMGHIGRRLIPPPGFMALDDNRATAVAELEEPLPGAGKDDRGQLRRGNAQSPGGDGGRRECCSSP